MRILSVVVLSIVLGLVLGIGSTWAKFGFSWNAAAPSAGIGGERLPAKPAGPQPKVVTDEEEFDFGTLERDSATRHAFHFTNAGDAPLTLKKGGTTCMRCTISDLPKEQLAPGESLDVVIQYTASTSDPEFRQSATILTNDPERQRIELTVFGKIAWTFRMIPSELVFSNIAVGEAKTIEMRMLTNGAEELNILSSELVDKASAQYFDAQVEPLTAEQLKEDNAKAGCLLKVTVKPGLPVGPIRQKLHLTTSLPHKSSFELPIQGRIESDISIVDSVWNAETGVLNIGPVKSALGIKRNLLLVVKGRHRHDVRFSIGDVYPDALKVKLGQSEDLKFGAAVKVPLTVEILPDSPPVSHIGSDQSKLARITLHTTHPEVPQLVLLVRFSVER